ncbi:MAG: four-carbon acid sugar kinase family protein [Candidatus Acetothermia bacterium]
MADDLTGSGEIVALLTREGVFPKLMINPPREACSGLNGKTSMVLDLELRSLAPVKAYETIKWFSEFREIAQNLKYLKVDSTLRGNFIAEIEGLVESEFFDAVIFAPAFPGMGRQTVGGYHLVDGRPLERTDYANRINDGVDRSNIYQYFTAKSENLKPGLVELSVIEKGPDRAAARMGELIENGANVIVMDAAEKRDLEVIASASYSTPCKLLMAGSAGLFQALLGAYEPNIVGFEPSSDPALVVCGSLNTVARRQLRLLGKSEIDLKPFEISLEDLIDIGRGKPSSKVESVHSSLRKGHNVALSTPSDFVQLPDSQMKQVEKGLGIMTEQLIQIHHGEISGLILTGGETATAVLRALKIRELQIIGELEPLIPVASAPRQFPFKIITKAGGFGSDQILLKAVKSVRGAED